YLVLPFEDGCVNAPPPLGLISTDPHRDVVFHPCRAQLVLQWYHGKRQIIALSVIGGDRSPQKANIDRPVDNILNHLMGWGLGAGVNGQGIRTSMRHQIVTDNEI